MIFINEIYNKINKFLFKKKILNKSIFLLFNINRKTSGKEYDESQKNTIYRKGTNGRDKKGKTGGCSLSPEGTVSFIPKDIPPNMNQRASYDGVLPS